MQASPVWQRFVKPVASVELSDVRREMIVEISAAMIGVNWLVVVIAIGDDRYKRRDRMTELVEFAKFTFVNSTNSVYSF